MHRILVAQGSCELFSRVSGLVLSRASASSATAHSSEWVYIGESGKGGSRGLRLINADYHPLWLKKLPRLQPDFSGQTDFSAISSIGAHRNLCKLDEATRYRVRNHNPSCSTSYCDPFFFLFLSTSALPVLPAGFCTETRSRNFLPRSRHPPTVIPHPWQASSSNKHRIAIQDERRLRTPKLHARWVLPPDRRPGPRS